MAERIEIQAQLRPNLGKAHTRKMRREQDLLPAIVYGADKAPQSITLPANEMRKWVQKQSFFSQILTLKLGETSTQVVLKALQRHPARDYVMHVDLMRINANEKITMLIPVHVVGADVCPGVKAGGMVSQIINELEVRCLPAMLPEAIIVDISAFELEQSVHLTELNLPKGVDLIALSHGTDGAHDQAVVHVHLSRHAAEAESETVEAAEGVQLGPEESAETSAEGEGS